MIVVLLLCSSNLVQSQIVQSKPVTPSTGEIVKSDTSKVIIPISFLRDANAKLIERIYLIQINKQQDSIINLNKSYITEQYKIIDTFKVRIVNITNDNNTLKTSLVKQQNKNKVLTGISIGAVVTTILTLFLK